MFGVLHLPTGIAFKVYHARANGGKVQFLIYKDKKWRWLDADECEPQGITNSETFN